MRADRMDYHQEYIPHEYIELKMPAGQDSNGGPVFLLDHSHLHIWPRHSFMLIALPNKVRDRITIFVTDPI
jgi:kynurenine 3-monooxygenase